MRRKKGQAPLLNVARWIERSEANGPGERFVLWLQGCPLRCLGCWNPDTWDFAARNLMSVDQVMATIAAVRGIAGVTLTGGEPFAQARALRHLAPQIRSQGLSLMIFTGYRLEELTSDAAREVLTHTDIVVAGRFILSERDEFLRWRGSRNQQVHFLTERYSPTMLQDANITEFIIARNGEMQVTGFPSEALLGELRLKFPVHARTVSGARREPAYSWKCEKRLKYEGGRSVVYRPYGVSCCF
jgi:anaerobic ribonucleoside-triphosphate reductase activating protein